MPIFNLLFILVFIFVAITIMPWLFIWAINTLVAAGGITTFLIPFNFWTWLAAFVLLVVFKVTRKN